jgi:hypothetical protein
MIGKLLPLKTSPIIFEMMASALYITRLSAEIKKRPLSEFHSFGRTLINDRINSRKLWLSSLLGFGAFLFFCSWLGYIAFRKRWWRRGWW